MSGMSATIASLSEAQLSESTAILDDALAGDAILEVQQHLLPQLQMMRSDGLMCDVTLIFGEGSAQRHFKAHKAVLVAVCQTFHMMAQNHTLDNHTSYEIRGVISELGAQAVESLLEFTYSGILRVNVDTMWLLHYVSEKMSINEAVQLCEAFIYETLGIDVASNSNTMNPITNLMPIEQREFLQTAVNELLILPILKNEPTGQNRKRPTNQGAGLIPLKRIKREPGCNYTAGINITAPTTTTTAAANTASAKGEKRRKYSVPQIKQEIGDRLRYGRRFQSVQKRAGKCFKTGRFPLPYNKICFCGQGFQFHSTLALHRRVCRHPRAIDKNGRYIPPIDINRVDSTLAGSIVMQGQVAPKYCCPICSDSFSLITQCRAHILSHHNRASRTCHMCQETFGSERILRVHRIRSHRQLVSSEKVLTCYICPRFFKHKNSVYKHIVLNHRGSHDTTLSACPTCPQVFNSGNSLYCHIVEKHNVLPEKYGVYESPANVSESVSLNEQTQSAIVGLGPSAVGLVDVGPSSVALIGRDMNLPDTGSQGFTCEYCMQPFNNEDTLLKHLGLSKVSDLFIATEKNGWHTITCLICGMDHATDQDLKVHMRVHRHEKSLICVECLQIFKCRTHLSNHVKEHHNLHDQLQTIAQTLECSLEALLLLKWGHVETLCQKYGQKAIKCAHCPSEFLKPKALALHLVEEHSLPLNLEMPHLEDSFWPSTGVWHKCEVLGCSATFRKLELMRRHMRAKHPKILYKCMESKCKFKTQVKTELNRHWNMDHLQTHKKDLVCTICNKRFKKNWNIRVHMAGKHKIVDPKLTQFHCNQPDCGFVAYTKAAVNVHMAGSHLNLRPFECMHCKKAFKQKGALNMHMTQCKFNPDRVERQKENYGCDLCGRNLSSAYTLYVHQRSVHRNDKDYACDMCTFKTNHQWGLSHHMLKIHKVIPPNRKIYRCDLCDYVCIKPNLIKEHRLRHTGKPSLQCPHCDKLCYTQPELNSHVKSTHSLIKYECEFCNQLLRNVSDLERHVVLQHTHRGLKPWKCPYCEYRSGLKGNIQLHCKKQHRDKQCTALQEFPMPKVKLNLRKVRISREEMQRCRKRRDIVKLPLKLEQPATELVPNNIVSDIQRTVQLPAGTILGSTSGVNNTSVDVGATVGATVELMENGSYRIAANNPQQLQQLQQLVVSRGNVSIQPGQALTATSGTGGTSGTTQTALFQDGILTIPTITAQPANEIVVSQPNIQQILLQQPITQMTSAPVQQQHGAVAGQLQNQTLMATNPASVSPSPVTATIVQQAAAPNQQQPQTVQIQQTNAQGQPVLQQNQSAYLSTANQVMQYLSDSSQVQDSNTTRLYYHY